MICAGHKPINALSSLPSEKQSDLTSLWVESVEEFAALAATVEEASVAVDNIPEFLDLLESVRKNNDDLFASRFKDYSGLCHPGGSLGCAVPPEVMAGFKQHGSLSTDYSKYAFTATKASLPGRADLSKRLFPVRNQGGRGTCVAFASTALREFLIECEAGLSEQFLYWACKELDGMPEESGTYVRTAMAALNGMGICRTETWRYNPNEIPGNEGQGPPPSGSEKEALNYIMPYTRSVAPNCVEHYKQILTEADGIPAMPVVVGVLVFNSWLISPAANQTGKITMPLPGEMPVGGHAMLVVGYNDDATVPGGGYFIVRNSWGEGWAVDSPETSGHAMMPYAYIEKYCMEAFSGQTARMAPEDKTAEPAEREAAKMSERNSFEDKYVRKLEQDTRDIHGRLLKCGMKVLSAPDEPGQILEDTPANRARFEKDGFACGPDAVGRKWFPPVQELPADFTGSLNKAKAACGEFMHALNYNLKESKGQPLPDINLPGWYRLLAWMPKVSHVSIAADLTGELLEKLIADSRIPEHVEMPDLWRTELAGVNSLKVFSVRGIGVEFQVVTGFVTPVRFSCGNPAIVQASQATANIIKDIYDQWSGKSGGAVTYTFYSLASYSGWSDEVTGYVGGDCWKMLSSPSDNGWLNLAPRTFEPGYYTRNFLFRLYPETSSQRVERIRRIIEEHRENGEDGNLHLDKVSRLTGISHELTKLTFDRMQNSDDFHCYKTPSGKIAITKQDGKTKSGKINLSPEPGVVKSHVLGFLATFIAVAAWQIGGYFSKGNIWVGLLLLPVLIYVAQCLETIIKRSMK